MSRKPTRTTPDFSRAREVIAQQMTEHSIPGVAVAVLQRGAIIWEEGFGWADRENRIPVTPHTMFSLASVSKPIATTGIMVLKHRGKLQLDAPANRYLGRNKLVARIGSAERATVRRLADHTSGLPPHCQFFYADEPFQRPPMEETLRRYGYLLNRPGERYCYCNLGYGVLDYIVERLSGKSFPDFMREDVFLPLGMMHSSVGVAPDLKAFEAIRYGSDRCRYPAYDFDHPGGSAVYSSCHDLMLLAKLHLKALGAQQKKIMSDACVDEMKVSKIPPALKQRYGVGWSLREQFGYQSVEHGGGMGGVSTRLALIPSAGCAIAVLLNTGQGLVGGIGDEVLSALLPEFGRRRAEAAKKNKAKPKPPAERTLAIKPDRRLSGIWKGAVHTYLSETPVVLTATPAGHVFVQIGKQLTALVNEPRLAENHLQGHFAAQLDGEDINRRPYRLHLDLRLRKKVLTGGILAVSTSDQGEGGAPGKRLGNTLAHWTELRKR